MRSVVSSSLLPLLMASLVVPWCSPLSTTRISRRDFVGLASLSSTFVLKTARAASGDVDDDGLSTIQKEFHSEGYSRTEYTNSITASRDTNISPKEVYDTILRVKKGDMHGKATRALDMGAGAGVSTQLLWDMGFREIDAVDWSSDAWDANVRECPDSVHFFQLDDERFLKNWLSSSSGQKYDVVVFNFAINRDKALLFCQKVLKDDGVLLAPVNVQRDYWMKQSYALLDKQGNALWTANDVGAWSVQFQPDVTQDTCQGIWCPPYNGFQRMAR